MSLIDKLKNLINRLKEKHKQMKAQMQRGREVTEQMMAEKKRKKLKKDMDRKPGAIKAIVDGLALKEMPWTVAGKEYSRRKYERGNKK